MNRTELIMTGLLTVAVLLAMLAAIVVPLIFLDRWRQRENARKAETLERLISMAQSTIATLESRKRKEPSRAQPAESHSESIPPRGGGLRCRASGRDVDTAEIVKAFLTMYMAKTTATPAAEVPAVRKPHNCHDSRCPGVRRHSCHDLDCPTCLRKGA